MVEAKSSGTSRDRGRSGNSRSRRQSIEEISLQVFNSCGKLKRGRAIRLK